MRCGATLRMKCVCVCVCVCVSVCVRGCAPEAPGMPLSLDVGCEVGVGGRREAARHHLHHGHHLVTQRHLRGRQAAPGAGRGKRGERQ